MLLRQPAAKPGAERVSGRAQNECQAGRRTSVRPGAERVCCATVPIFTAGSNVPASAHLRDGTPRRLRLRRDFAAACAAVAVLLELALAQATLVLTVAFVITGRLTRWRPTWLAWPAVVGLSVFIARRQGAAVAGYLAFGRHLVQLFTGNGPALALLVRLEAVYGGWRRWLPAQLPVALLAASAQAGLISRRRGQAGPYRPGALATARRAYLTVSLRRGEVATGDGGCVGIVAATGRPAEITWREAERGVLVTGTSAAAVTGTGRDLASAAIKHRKALLVIDLASGTGDLTAASVAAACEASKAPLLRLGDACYDPFSGLPPTRAAGLALAMLDWTDVREAARSLCAWYLSCALEVIAAGGGPDRPRGSMIGELAALTRPGALTRRLNSEHLAIRNRDALMSRAAEWATRLDDDSSARAALAAAAVQLAGLASSDVAGWLVPAAPPDGEQVSLARALAERQVVLACLDSHRHGLPGVMVARLAVADLTWSLAERRDCGAPADCVVWINDCDAIGRDLMSELLALGQAAGASVVFGATEGAAADELADLVNVVVSTGAAQQLGDLAVRVRGPVPRLVEGCRAVR
jgi:hypothetical protein